MFFCNFQCKILCEISWFDCEKYGRNQDKKRKHKQISVFKVLWLTYYLNVTDPLISQWFLYFYLVVKRLKRFLGSGLKSIFHWYAHWEITLRSRFKYLADSLGSWTIEKREVSSANNLAIELSPSGRSLIYIKNNRGPRMDPCGTPALIGNQLDFCPFNNTL